jgi:hypothetical protein
MGLVLVRWKDDNKKWFFKDFLSFILIGLSWPA